MRSGASALEVDGEDVADPLLNRAFPIEGAPSKPQSFDELLEIRLELLSPYVVLIDEGLKHSVVPFGVTELFLELLARTTVLRSFETLDGTNLADPDQVKEFANI